jgi:hypothetical protein
MQSTVRKKYGVENVAQNIAVKKKKEATCISRYGNVCPVISDLVKKKQKRSLSDLYYDQIKERMLVHNISLCFPKEDYTNGKHYKEYGLKCMMCKTEYSGCFTHGHTPLCPNCFPVSDTSSFETELYEFLCSIIDSAIIEKNNRKVLNGQEIDFFIPSKNTAIELNGNYWHSEISGKKYKNYHLNKTLKCERSGIHLIHIFEDEWINKKDIIKNKLTYLLAPKLVRKVYARDCVIRPIDSKTCNHFLEKTHLQGKDKSSIKYGAFYLDDLIAVMTFGKNRIALGNTHEDGEYELYRYCADRSITGILSKFISRFLADHKTRKITTYADRRFSTPTKCGYEKCGFKFVKSTSPNYWYTHKNSLKVREHRYKYRKNVLEKILPTYSNKLTEWENMKTNGYDRIWDCGHLKFELVVQ